MSQKPTTAAASADEHTRTLQEFREQIKRGIPFTGDYPKLESIIDALRHPDARAYFDILSDHPAGIIVDKLTNATVELLYNDLPHPPQTSLGTQFAWRTADGSNNNAAIPDLGKAGTPYARSVQQIHALPRSELPDAGLIFDTLLKREEAVTSRSNSVFRTSHSDVNINDTSSTSISHLSTATTRMPEQDTSSRWTGPIASGHVCRDRLLLLPPAVCVLLVLFNRNHNYIAKMLLQINERGTYADPATISTSDPKRSAKILAQEEEIFQTARLINCTWFASVVFSDYFSAILGLVRQGSSWSLDPFGEIRNLDHSLFERGRGNVCSVEFNCLYRWHATTSVHDEKWVEQLIAKIFPNKSWDEVHFCCIRSGTWTNRRSFKITIADFKETAKTLQAQEPGCTEWTFDNLQRQKDGSFKDEELAQILHAATENPASAFKARGTPHVMRLHEIMGIESNRQWGFLGLKTYSSFLEWNPDPEIAAAAEKLYGHIDRLELYVGLQAEDAKPVIPGAGLCPADVATGYTISRAILSDAIALTRGDRFYTSDYTPFNMTSWGFADCQRDPAGPGNGSTLGRLFLRTLPGQFTANSTYTWFPLMTPDAMQPILTNLNELDMYDFARPGVVPPVQEISHYLDVAQVLGNEAFNVRYASRAAHVITGDGFFIASPSSAQATREQRAFFGALTSAPGSADEIAGYFYQKTRELMLREAYTMVGSQTQNVDIVRDVLRHVPIHWASELAGIRLKSPGSEHGDYTPQELFDILGDIYSYLFLDIPEAKVLKLQQKVKADVDKLLHVVGSDFSGPPWLSLGGLVEAVTHMFFPQQKSGRDELMGRLDALGYAPETLCNSVLAVLVGGTVEMSQACINVVNFYLDEKKPADVQALIKMDSGERLMLQGVVNEALRPSAGIDPPFRGVYREAARSASIGGHNLQAGQPVFVDIASANVDLFQEHVFPRPHAVNPSRGAQTRYLIGDGSAKCFGADLSTKIIGEVVRAVFGFPHLRRAPGQSGCLKRFKEDSSKTSTYSYLSSAQELTPWAGSMVVQFDRV
ncbi:linoleate diol synthase [Amylocystis lapponica]|nr:linoleate diol synthase [Amylocystis lapponica]